MQVILLDHLEKVGVKHEIVKVRDGYGRNYLIPQGLAIIANKSNMARLDGIKKIAEKKEAANIGTYREFANKLSQGAIQIQLKAGESGRLFGSLNTLQLAVEIKNQYGIDLDRRIISMPEVKEVGSYEAIVKFHPEVQAVVKFDVLGEGQAAPKKVEVAPTVEVVAAPVVEAASEPVVVAAEEAADDDDTNA